MNRSLLFPPYLLSVVVLIFLCQCGSLAQAPPYTTYKNAGKKALKFYQKGKEAQKKGETEEAKLQFQKAIEVEPNFIDPFIKLGDMLISQGDFTQAIDYFQKAIRINPDYSLRLHYAIAKMYYEQQQFQKAVAPLSYFLSKIPQENRKANATRLMNNLQFAIAAIENPMPFSPYKLPTSINTKDSEYLPSFSADGTQLIYTAVRRGQEDFYFSRKKDGVWQRGEPLIGINTNNNEGAQTISGDGRTLIFTGCNRKDGFGSCDLYISYKREDYWSRPVNMGRVINSNSWESQPSLSSNGRILFFASTRSGGFGKSDIYRSILGKDGMWSIPENLGPAVNTTQDELGPFIHADGETLYFVSSGHPGMGGNDLFKTEYLGDNAWDNPQNLGYPINTTGDESTLIVSLNGKLGYFASNFSKSMRTTDIYEFELPESIRPKPVTYLKAKVIDAITKVPLSAAAELYEVATGAVRYGNNADEEGLFLVSLPAGQRYGLNVAMENYLFHSEQFDLVAATSFDQPYDLLIELQPILPVAVSKEDQPKPIILKNIFFETASASLLPVSTKELQRLYQLLIDNPSMKIQINGHTDDVGNDEDNLALSRDRAKAVFNYLIQEGISETRLSFKGYGETTPIENNDSPQGRQANRRTEFVVIQ